MMLESAIWALARGPKCDAKLLHLFGEQRIVGERRNVGLARRAPRRVVSEYLETSSAIYKYNSLEKAIVGPPGQGKKS
jgi:hypothetical protein